MTTEVMQAASILESKRYVIAHIYDGPAHSFVAFLDPHTLSKDWTGKQPFGLVKFTVEEIRAMRAASDGRQKLYARVKEAEDKLLHEIGSKEARGALKSVTVSLSLSLLVAYPMVKIIAM